jgi:hypothetical protein
VETPLLELLENIPIKEEEPSTLLTQLLGFVYKYYTDYYKNWLAIRD